MRSLLLSLAVVGLVITIGLPLYLGPDDIAGCKQPVDATGDRCETVDAIIAISGGDTAARTDEAIRLYQAGWSDLLVFSGAALDKTGPSNASVMRRQAVNAGVPEANVLIEEHSATTGENATKTAEVLSAVPIKRVILVTSAYHQRRAYIEFSKALGEDVMVVNHPVTNDRQWSSWWWMTPYGWWLGISEVVKIAFSGVFPE